MGAEIQDGAVLVARAILNSSLWTMSPNDRIVAITAICVANWKPKKWFDGEQQVMIERGQFVRSWQGLADECNLSVKEVRTSVEHLETVGFLARKRARSYSIFTIPKYQHYQDLTKYSDSMSIKGGQGFGQDTGSQAAGNGQAKGNKQEGNNGIREESNNSQSAHNGSVEAHIISAWNRGPGFPISHPQGQKLVRAYIDSGVSAERQLELVSNQPACKGKKFWEVVEPMRPANGESIPSIDEILNNWAKKEASK